TNIVQDVPPPTTLTACVKVNGIKTCGFGSPSYWNNTLYFPGAIAPLLAYPITNNGTGLALGSLPSSQTTGAYSGEGSVSISSNGTSNGIAWSITWGSGSWTQLNGTLRAYDATNLANELYDTDQAANLRDTLGNVAKYGTPTVANGKVYAATQSQLLVYGLLYPLKPNGGNKQGGKVKTTLPLPLTVAATNAYTGKPAVGVPVSFSDSNAGGTFGTPQGTTDSNGNFSTTYTLPSKTGTYTLTVSGATAVSTTFSASATSGAIGKLSLVSGGSQSGPVGTTLPQPIVVAAKDSYGNYISGLSITFSDGGAGGIFSPNPVNTGSNGRASVGYSLPTKASNSISVTATASSVHVTTSEKALAGPAASVSYVSGNHQFAPPYTLLPNPLVVVVKDQYMNLITGASVTFSDNGAGGSFSSNGTVITGTNGRATISYTTGSQQGSVNISGAISVLPPAFFVETVD
ncbi:MAG: hypothetical protein WB562_16580, partial [Candidatus Sulfotelmatobacter sp.]